ncbi:hypothetical protein KR018_004544 [Drosophila ironensis]|nr:hypothetical protein KR018_004544 [Drosophila ironensis]
MFRLTNFVFILILSQVLTLDQQYSLRPLTKLTENLQKDREISVIFMLQHHKAQNCETDNWNPNGIPILRFNDQSEIVVRRNFNNFYAMAVVCITEDSHVQLLDNLAVAFDNMRQERIILWLQRKATPELLQHICTLSENHGYINIILLEAGTLDYTTQNLKHLEAFPSPHFVEGMYKDTRLDYRGKTAVVARNQRTSIFHVKYAPGVEIPDFILYFRGIVEFALAYNLTLRSSYFLMFVPKEFDIIFPDPIQIETAPMESVTPFEFIKLVVVVPCGKQKRFAEILQLVDICWWVLPICIVYIAIVVVESLTLVVINRITGRHQRWSILYPLVNLRAFATILGLIHSPNPRWNLSMRQLYCVLSIFGFVLGTFFTFQLSAYLTNPPVHRTINSFEELKASGLPVVVDKRLRLFIQDHVDRDFFDSLVTNPVSMNPPDRLKNLFLLNDSFANIIHKDFWDLVDMYQKQKSVKVFCTCDNFALISNKLENRVLKKNSIYLKPLTGIYNRLTESGIIHYWRVLGSKQFFFNHNFKANPKPETVNKVEPISVNDLKFPWLVLVIGYLAATLIFLAEMFVKCRQFQIESRLNPLPNFTIRH